MRTRSYSATLAMLVLVAASASLGACLGDDEEGIFRLDSVAQDSQGGDATDTGSEDTPLVSDTTSNDIVMDSAIEDTAVEDTTPMASCNGNGTLDLDEACDDGNACAQDGCNSCTLETTVVLTALAVSDAAGFDLDNADGDDDRYTGLENKFGESPLLRAVINPLIEAALRRGDVIQLINIGQVEDPTSADEVVLSFIPGVDPACPISASPVPWLGGPATTAIYTDAQAFSMCRPAVVISDTDDSANGIYQATFNAAQPSAPLLFMSAFTVALPTGLGDLDVARTHIEATVEIAANDAVVPGIAGLTDGRLGGIISAATLYRLDTSAASGRCPTALHVMLGLSGHLDMDREDNGGLDFIQFTTSGGDLPCVDASVNIVGCCNDGDCATGLIGGEACALDPQIGDGYSAAFAFEARRVSVTGQVDGASYCEE